MIPKPIAVALSLVALVTTGAVAQAQAGKAVPSAPPAPATPDDEELSAEDRARRAKVVARVGEKTITLGDVEDAINAQSPFLRTRYKDPERLQQFVKKMIRFELLAEAAEEKGYGDNPAVVKARKQNAVQQLIRKEFDEKITPSSISDEDVQKYYDEHQEEFSRPEMVRASHVLLDSKEKAEELLDEAEKADARGFRQLAREHSVDTETKRRGGDLRYFTREGRPPRSEDQPVNPALVEAAFSLDEVGDVVAEPIKVEPAEGEPRWSIVKLTGKRPAEHRSLEDAEKGIRLRLWRERRQQAIEDFVDKLRKRFEPEVYEDRMRPIRLETEQPPSPAKGFPGHKGAKPGKASPKGPAIPATEKEPAKKGKKGSKPSE